MYSQHCSSLVNVLLLCTPGTTLASLQHDEYYRDDRGRRVSLAKHALEPAIAQKTEGASQVNGRCSHARLVLSALMHFLFSFFLLFKDYVLGS